TMKFNYLKTRMLHYNNGRGRRKKKSGGGMYRTELDELALAGKISFDEYIEKHPYKDLIMRFIEIRNNTDLSIDEASRILGISKSRYMFYKKVLDRFHVIKKKERGRRSIITEELIEKVYQMIQDGRRKYEISEELGISNTVINKIVQILKARGKLPEDFKFKYIGVSDTLNVNKYNIRRFLNNLDVVYKMLENGKSIKEIADMYQLTEDYVNFVIDAIRMYNEGKTYHQIAEKYRTTEVRVYRIIKFAIEKGIVKERFNREEIRRIVFELRKEGYTPYRIYKILNERGIKISFKTVYNIVNDYYRH
ncbi:hypothetical protein DRJ16_05470, partial [Candidatus Woesearchaeota archaeon]